MDDISDISAAVIVLAAGDSSRMGRPKALLDWHGKPMIEHVLATALSGGCTRSLVVLGRDAEGILAGADLGGAQVVVNPDPSQGQVSSIKLGMQHQDFSTDCCVVWPVDCPLVQAGDVRALIESYGRMRTSLMRIFIPVHAGRRGHPMLVDIGFGSRSCCWVPATRRAKSSTTTTPRCRKCQPATRACWRMSIRPRSTRLRWQTAGKGNGFGLRGGERAP